MQWLYFFGHFHPLLVHLPIGFLLIGFAMELAARRERYQQLRPAIPFVLLLSALSAVATALVGYFLSLEGGYEGQALAIHQWSGIGVAVLSISVYAAKTREWTKLYMPLFSTTVFLLLVAGHYGGTLTHGNSYLTDAAPDPVKRLLGAPRKAAAAAIDLAALDTTPMYLALVHPILDDKCVSCHREGKTKGELRLDTPEGLRRGGEHGELFVAGQPSQSLLLERIHLPVEHDDHMPPDGKPQLGDEEKTLLEWWIKEGGSFEKKVGEAENDDEIRQILERRFKPKVENPVFALDISPLEEKELLALQNAGLRIMPLAQNSSYLEGSLENSDSLDKTLLELLLKAGEQLVRLDLGNTGLTDEMTGILAGLPHLTHLSLDRNPVSDATLTNLQDLQYLEYLNLYQTQISDEGLALLASLPQLRRLFLWQTRATKKGIATLQKANPQLQVVAGVQNDSLFSSGPLPPPSIKAENQFFNTPMTVELEARADSVDIRYTLDGSEPDSSAVRYTGPVEISETILLRTRTLKKGRESSEVAEKQFILARHQPANISLNNAPSDRYAAQGAPSLIDLKKGSEDFQDGRWLGWEGRHVEVTLDLGSSRELHAVTVGTLEAPGSWIFFPKGIEVSVSDNGQQFRKIAAETYPLTQEDHAPQLRSLRAPFPPTQAQYLRVKVVSRLKNPGWHPAAGEKCWMFLDEISVE